MGKKNPHHHKFSKQKNDTLIHQQNKKKKLLTQNIQNTTLLRITRFFRSQKTILSIVFLSLFGLVFLFGYFQFHHYDNRIMPGVYLEGSYVGGLSYEEFKQQQDQFLINKESLPIVYEQHQSHFAMESVKHPQYIDLLWKHLITYHRRNQTSIIQLKKILIPEEISLRAVDIIQESDQQKLIQPLLRELYQQYNLEKPYNGKIAYSGDIIMEQPRPGLEIIPTDLFVSYLAYIYLGKEIILPVQEQKPLLTKDELALKKEQLEKILKTQKILISEKLPKVHYQLTSQDIKKYARASYSFDSDSFIFSFDTDLLDNVIHYFKPRNAQRTYTKDYRVDIDPGRRGINIQDYEIQEILRKALVTDSEEFTFREGTLVDQSIYAQDIDMKGFKHIVSEFTTYHGCCQNRVDNIHRIADLLDGVILEPGEILNINQRIGERTVENGFKSAGSILKGEMVDSVGGGISQFITTLHNAVYWGGYEIIAHKPHSIYFSRYPVGVEATVNWPYVDYIFRNDTKERILIDTEYTDTSITVRILGDNDSRVFIGDHRKGRTFTNIYGGSNQSRKVISKVSPRYNYRPALVRYENNTALKRGEQIILKQGKPGWTVDVLRKVIQDGNTLHTDDESVHYFSGVDTVIAIHPCDNPSIYTPHCGSY